MRLLASHCFFLTLITVFYMFSTIHPYLFLLFSHFLFLFSPLFSYSSCHETHSTIYNVWLDLIATFPKYYGDKKYFTVHNERKNLTALIFLWYKLWVFPLTPYQLTFFSVFGTATNKSFFSYDILKNILI